LNNQYHTYVDSDYSSTTKISFDLRFIAGFRYIAGNTGLRFIAGKTYTNLIFKDFKEAVLSSLPLLYIKFSKFVLKET
jgi:hypothetical protein